MALPVNGSTHLIPAYYSFIDPERMKGWVGLVGWPIVDGLPTLVSSISCRSSAGQGKFASQTFYTVPRDQLTMIGVIIVLPQPHIARLPGGPVKICRSSEVEDSCIYSDTDPRGFDEHKPVILHLLSQLKLGMDLTKVASLCTHTHAHTHTHTHLTALCPGLPGWAGTRKVKPI